MRPATPCPAQTVDFAGDDGQSIGPVTYNADDGVYEATVTSTTRVGDAHITATSGALHDTATLAQAVGDPATVDVALDKTAVDANDTDTFTATATVKDSAGHPVKGAIVDFTAEGAMGAGPVSDHGDGTYSATITADTEAGHWKVTATSGTASGDAYIDVRPTAPTNLRFDLRPGHGHGGRDGLRCRDRAPRGHERQLRARPHGHDPRGRPRGRHRGRQRRRLLHAGRRVDDARRRPRLHRDERRPVRRRDAPPDRRPDRARHRRARPGHDRRRRPRAHDRHGHGDRRQRQPGHPRGRHDHGGRSPGGQRHRQPRRHVQRRRSTPPAPRAPTRSRRPPPACPARRR